MADIGLGVECEVVGQERSRAIDNLHDIGEDLCLVCVAIILGTVAIDICRTLVYQHIAEALDMTLGVAHGTIGCDDCAVVVGCEVTHYDHNLLAVVSHLPTLVRLHIDIVTLAVGALLGRQRWSGLLLLGLRG